MYLLIFYQRYNSQLQGYAMLCNIPHDLSSLQNILDNIATRVSSLSPAQICKIVIYVNTLRMKLYIILEQMQPSSENGTKEQKYPDAELNKSPLNKINAIDSDTENNQLQGNINTTQEDMIIDSLDPIPTNTYEKVSNLQSLCHDILLLSSQRISATAAKFTTKHYLSILQSISIENLFQADDMVDAIDLQVKKRAQALKLASATSVGADNIQALVQRAADYTLDAVTKMGTLPSLAREKQPDDENDGKSENDQTFGKNSSRHLKEAIEVLNRAAAAACEANARSCWSVGSPRPTALRTSRRTAAGR